ncbi:hypothetical protein LCGC14_2281890, partial [marine sediment metagenome]
SVGHLFIRGWDGQMDGCLGKIWMDPTILKTNAESDARRTTVRA